MTSIARNLTRSVLKNQTHISDVNVFENITCSHCKRKGHNILFCFDISIKILLHEIIQKFIFHNTSERLPQDKITD